MRKPKTLDPMPAEKLRTQPAVISFSPKNLLISEVISVCSSMNPKMLSLYFSSSSEFITRSFRLLI